MSVNQDEVVATGSGEICLPINVNERLVRRGAGDGCEHGRGRSSAAGEDEGESRGKERTSGESFGGHGGN